MPNAVAGPPPSQLPPMEVQLGSKAKRAGFICFSHALIRLFIYFYLDSSSHLSPSSLSFSPSHLLLVRAPRDLSPGLIIHECSGCCRNPD